jgi:putative transposase
VKTKLALSERTYHCDHCGLDLDRDVNAARNLLHLAASGAESQNACGCDTKSRSLSGSLERRSG